LLREQLELNEDELAFYDALEVNGNFGSCLIYKITCLNRVLAVLARW
jgi:hypothetical protein